MPSRPRASRERRGRRWKVIVIVGALLVVDAVLIGFAINGRTPEPQNTSAPQGEIVEPESDLATDPAPTPEPTAPPAPPAPPATGEPQRVMTALDATTAWRVATGTCADPAVSPEVTRDGGAAWTAFDATAATGIRSAQRLIVSSVDAVAIVGLGAEECAPTLVRTYVGGEDWAEYPDEVGSAWYIADEGAGVHAPGGDVQAPCPAGVVALSVSRTDAAAALCRDGGVASTVDGGATWGAVTAIAGAQALAPQPDGYLAAVLGSEGCAGIAIMTLDAAAAAPTMVGCRESGANSAELAGRIALSESGDGTLWLWAGDDLARSADRGATWL